MSKSKPTKLSDTQLVILSEAAERADLCIFPIPTSVKAMGGALSNVLKSLVARGLVAERPNDANTETRPPDQAGEHVALVITDAGLAALGIEATLPDPVPAESSVALPRSGTKAAVLTVQLLRPDGASLQELMDTTGWQAHSVRGFLSGTMRKKFGLNVISERLDGVRRYRIAASS